MKNCNNSDVLYVNLRGKQVKYKLSFRAFFYYYYHLFRDPKTQSLKTGSLAVFFLHLQHWQRKNVCKKMKADNFSDRVMNYISVGTG